jgi:hypothetical protein
MSPLLSSFPFVQGGSAGTPKATVTGTTGSPTVDTSSRPGKTIYKFTGSGSITVGVAGTCEYLVIGGGVCNAAGGLIYRTSAVLPSGTLTVTVGAGFGFPSTSGGSGNPSRLGDVVALAGGFADFGYQAGTMPFQGGSSGGSRVTGTTRSAALSGAQGNNGGQGTTGSMGPAASGGGGGAGGVGGNTSGFTGGNGGAGSANSITGSSVTYAAGAGGYGQTANGTPTGNGAANTGNGGSMTGDGSSTNTGGSGFVVVVIG